MSNKKNLLNEAQVRQFMKLASLHPLTPGFVNGLTEKVEEDLEEGTDEDLDESSARGSNEYSKPGHHKGGGVKSGGEPVNELVYRDDDEELESELGATEDELGDEDAFADEEGAELDDAEGADVDAEAETSLTIRQVVNAIETALEELLPNEEVDAEYVGDDDMDVEAEDEFAPEGDEVVADIEVGEEELEEVLGFGKSAADKAREKLALGKKGSYAPDAEAGEKSSAPTPEEIEAAKKEPRTRRPRRSAGDIAGGLGGGMRIGGISEGSTDDLVEQITKRVAARILKSALAKK
jgi:hypothetical protein